MRTERELCPNRAARGGSWTDGVLLAHPARGYGAKVTHKFNILSLRFVRRAP